MDGRKEIEIVPGDGNIVISPAEDQINDLISEKPKKENIVIPKVKEDPNKEDEDKE